jgi:hypothetical protein
LGKKEKKKEKKRKGKKRKEKERKEKKVKKKKENKIKEKKRKKRKEKISTVSNWGLPKHKARIPLYLRYLRNKTTISTPQCSLRH